MIVKSKVQFIVNHPGAVFEGIGRSILESLDRSYFSVICADAYDVTIMSKNAGHVWYIHNPEYPEPGNCIIFHKHRASHPYHRHGRGACGGRLGAYTGEKQFK